MFPAGTAVAATLEMVRTRCVVLVLAGVAACGGTTIDGTPEAAENESGAEAGVQVTDAGPDRDGGCAAGSSLYYATGGCSAQPACLDDSQDACLGVYCGCDGVTFNDGCDYSRKAFAKRGPCGDGSSGDSAPAPSCKLGGGCFPAQGCMGIVGCTSNCQCLDGTWQAPCPANVPPDGSACNVTGATCGFLTRAIACGGSVDCYCQSGKWSCSPTCVPLIEDASTDAADAGVE